MLCYKYMPWDYWFDSVLMGRLKLSVPSEFNDPFDCDGDVVGSYRQSVIDDWIDKNFEPSEELPTCEMLKSAFLLTYQEHKHVNDWQMMVEEMKVECNRKEAERVGCPVEKWAAMSVKECIAFRKQAKAHTLICVTLVSVVGGLIALNIAGDVVMECDGTLDASRISA